MHLDNRTMTSPYPRSLVSIGIALLSMPLLFTCSTNEMNRLASDVTGDLSNGEASRVRFDKRLVEACGQSANTPAGQDAFLRQPYLQQVTDSSAVVMWTSEGTAPAGVRVTRPDGSLVGMAPAVADASAPLPEGSQYTATITGLAPGQIHCYAVMGEDGAWTTPTGFVTAPPPAAPAPVRFVALGDLGIRGVDQWAVAAQLQTVEPDLAVVTGDVAYNDGKLSELESNFFGVYAPYLRHIPVFPASGNHDYHTDDAAAFRQVFSLFPNGGGNGVERWYSFDWGNVRFVMIDTERFLDEQAAWLDQDLASSSAEWTIVVGHRPPYSSGPHGSDLTIRSTFGPVFARHGVDLVLFGHDHHYERTIPIDGVTYIVTGGGGRGTRPVEVSDFTEVASQVAHFLYVEIEDRTLTLHAIDGSGEEFDGLKLEHAP